MGPDTIKNYYAHAGRPGTGLLAACAFLFATLALAAAPVLVFGQAGGARGGERGGDSSAAAAARAPRPAVAELRGRLAEREPSARADAARALGRAAEAGEAGAYEAIETAMDDANPLVRGTAAKALGRAGDARALARLRRALASEDRHTRWGAVEALAERGDRRAAPALIEALKHADKVTRWKAAQALGRLGEPAAIRPLARVALDAEEYIFARRAAAGALWAIGTPQALSGLEALAGAADAELGAWAERVRERRSGAGGGR